MSSVFKGLNRSDVYLTDYNSKKTWSVSGQELAELGIKVFVAMSSSRPYLPVDEDYLPYRPISGTVGVTSSYTEGTYNKYLAFGTFFESYYSGSLGDGTFEGPKDLSLQTDLTITGSRVMPTRNWRDERDTPCLPDHQQTHDDPYIVVIHLPKEVFGTHITPGTFKTCLDADVWCYVEDGYVDCSQGCCEDCEESCVDPCKNKCKNTCCCYESGSVCDFGYPEGTWTRDDDHWVDPYFEDLHPPKLIYDFEGLLLGSGSGFLGEWHLPLDREGNPRYRYPTPKHQENYPVGDMIYTHGQAIFTNEFIKFLMRNWDPEGYTWESNKPIFTKHITCKVRDIDFNRTYNLTANEKLQNTPGFTPYVSAVGLYNTRGDLLAVAKLSKPIKKALDTEMTFDIQIDLG